MSRIDGTLLLLRHAFHITYSGKGGDGFARHGAIGLAMSAALDDAGDTYGWVGDRNDLADARNANPGITPALANGLGRLAEMSGMPSLAVDYEGHAVKAYWEQLGAVVDHRVPPPASGPIPGA